MYIAAGSPDGASGRSCGSSPTDASPLTIPMRLLSTASVDLMPAGPRLAGGRRLVVDRRNEPGDRPARGPAPRESPPVMRSRRRARRRDRDAAPAAWHAGLGADDCQRGIEPVRRRRDRLVNRPRRSAPLRRQPRDAHRPAIPCDSSTDASAQSAASRPRRTATSISSRRTTRPGPLAAMCWSGCGLQ